MKQLIRILFFIGCYGALAIADTVDTEYTASKQFVVDLGEHFKRGVLAQANRLETLAPVTVKTPRCEIKYSDLWRSGTLKIDLFYGYMNNHKASVILDPVLAQTMTEVLSRKCATHSHGACGFQVISKAAKPGKTEALPVVLKKTISRAGKPADVIVRIFVSALTNRAATNQTPDQAIKSENVWGEFLSSLSKSNVVIYDGHGRYGAGPGFDVVEKPMTADDKIDRSRFERFKSGLKASTAKPGMIMLAACNSLQNYSKDLLKTAPGTTLLTTGDDIQAPGAGIQTVFTFIDSLVSERCEAQLKEALALVPDRAEGYGANGQIVIQSFE